MQIGNSLRLVRSIAGLTQDEMAAQLGITPSYLCMLEKSKARPSLVLLQEIEKHFDVPASFLVWNAHFESKRSDPDVSERYRKIGEQLLELATTLIRRKTHSKGK